MDLKVLAQARGNYVYVAARGTQSFRANIKIAEAAIKECVAAGKESVLVDVRGLSGETGTMDDYELAKLLEAWSANAVIKKAAILERAELFESALFFETALRNRGMNVKTFKDADLAEKWVEQQ